MKGAERLNKRTIKIENFMVFILNFDRKLKEFAIVDALVLDHVWVEQLSWGPVRPFIARRGGWATRPGVSSVSTDSVISACTALIACTNQCVTIAMP